MGGVAEGPDVPPQLPAVGPRPPSYWAQPHAYPSDNEALIVRRSGKLPIVV
jgi:hypothetical protein